MKKSAFQKQTFPDASPKDVQKELTTLQNHYSDILKKIGKHVLIQGSTIIDYFDSYSEAVNEGYKRFGLKSFLVRPTKNDVPIRAMRCGLKRMGNNLRLTKAAKA